MQRASAQYNNFLGGVTSELRTNFEVPKWSRLWNFDVSGSRAIQHYGLRNVLDAEAHLVEYAPALISLTDQWFINRHSVIAVESTGDATFIDTSCDTPNQSLALDSDVEMATLPIIYNDHLVWLDTNWDVWIKPLQPIAAAFKVLQNLDPITEANVQNSFFQKSIDGKLYIFSGKRVHRVEIADSNGNFNSGSELAEFQPIDQFMTAGDRNGIVGGYTGFLGPETQVITQVDEAQNILRVLGYYTGPVDGIFGDLTEQAVSEFQADYNSSGQYQSAGGQAPDIPLIVDGIIGPETQAVLNAVDDYNQSNVREKKNVLVLPDVITAVCENGGVINIATHDHNDNANVYYWDKTLTAEGIGDIGLLTSVTVGKGVVQILKPLNGRLMAIMTPATDSYCMHKYVKMSIYAIQANFDLLPDSYAVPVAEYNLRLGPDGLNFDDWRHNIINQKSIVANSRLYFSGQINLQSLQEPTDGEGVFAGVMSIDSNGTLFTEVCKSDTSDDLTFVPVNSFGMADSGFIIATEDEVLINHREEDNNISGCITDIINGGRPWEEKQIDNIFFSLHDKAEVDKVEIWVREVDNLNDPDAGWELAYDGNMQLNHEGNLGNSIQINKLDDGQPFWKFKELQVMVKVFGIGSEFINLTVNYNMLAINE